MTSAELQTKLEQSQAQLAAVHAELRDLHPKLAPVFAAKAEQWIDGEVQDRLKKFSAAFLDQPESKVVAFKAQLGTLKASLPEAFARSLGTYDEWIRRKKNPASDSDKEFKDVFEAIVNRLGLPLLHAGLAKLYGDDKWRYGDDPTFVGYQPINPSALPEISKYRTLETRRADLVKEISQGEGSLKQAKALERFSAL